MHVFSLRCSLHPKILRRRQAYLVLSGAISVIGAECQMTTERFAEGVSSWNDLGSHLNNWRLIWLEDVRAFPFLGQLRPSFSNLLLVSGSVSKIPKLTAEELLPQVLISTASKSSVFGSSILKELHVQRDKAQLLCLKTPLISRKQVRRSYPLRYGLDTITGDMLIDSYSLTNIPKILNLNSFLSVIFYGLYHRKITT